MSAKNCTDLADCFLSTAFDAYFSTNEFSDNIKKALFVSADAFRAIGISYAIISTAVAYGIHFSKISPLHNEQIRLIDSDTPRKNLALFFEKSVVLLGVAVSGFELFFFIPMSKFIAPDIRWNLFQGQLRTIEYKNCLGTDLPVINFLKEFGSLEIDLIETTNNRLNRVASVIGGTTLAISSLMAVQLVASCLLHKHFSKRDAVYLAFVIVGLAFGIFGITNNQAVNVAPDLNKGWDCCLNNLKRIA